MPTSSDQERLISHAVAPKSVDQIIAEKAGLITNAGDKSYVTAQRQLALLNQLGEFDFGRFLLQNKGINGYWTHYMLTHPWRKDRTSLSELETFLLERAPTIVATQERFMHFLNENQKSVKNGCHLACIPSGMMGELLYLDFSGIDDIKLTGVDFDAGALDHAQRLADEKNLSHFAAFQQADAWNLNVFNEFDLISSNGLNIYEPDDAKVIELYRQFFNSLKPGGKLVTSFLTPPPTMTDACEWQSKEINQDDAALQKIIFSDILNVGWQCYRSSAQTREQLESVGFTAVEIIPDRANLFPTVVAIKG